MLGSTFLGGVAVLFATALPLAIPAAAQAETKTLVSSSANSLCVNPTPGFAAGTFSQPNYVPLSEPHSGPIPDTGSACQSGFPTLAIALGAPSENPYPYSQGGHRARIPGASWVSLDGTAEDAPNPPPKYYIYDTTFNVCSNQIPGTRIEGTMLADDAAGAFLNGEPLANQGSFAYSNFFGPASVFGPYSGPALKVGLNTLQFVVIDVFEESTGLDFSAWVTSTESCQPEPTEFPGLGRCVKADGGVFTNSGCTTKGSHKKEAYEWLPGAGKARFTSSENASRIELGSHKDAVECSHDTDVGEYIGESEDFETITFAGCEVVHLLGASAGETCETKGEASGIIKTPPLRSLYGFIKLPKNVGVSLEPPPGRAFAEFECGTYAIPVVLESPPLANGSLIAPTGPVNEMESQFTEKFKASSGKQKPEQFETDPLDIAESSVNGGSWEQAGLKSTDTVTNEEPLEIRTEE